VAAQTLKLKVRLSQQQPEPATAHGNRSVLYCRVRDVFGKEKSALCTPKFADKNAIAAHKITMATATSTLPELHDPLPADASADAGFADSAIMDMNTPTISPQSKPQFESDQLESGMITPFDQPVEDRLQSLEHFVGPTSSRDEREHPDQIKSITNASSRLDERDLSIKSDASTESDSEADPELISHLSTTVSSLRLRHQEQSHLNSLFTSKLEALAQRSLGHEATIRSLTAELQSLRNSNTPLVRENAMLAHENNDLRVSMQGLKGKVVECETAMEAMTGAVRGLEGWIESANNSPRSNSAGRLRQESARYRRGKHEVIRGKGRFRGRYYLDDDDTTDINGGLGTDGSKDAEPLEIQEGVMAWVRGFRDVEEGLKARSESDGRGRMSRHVSVRLPTYTSNDTTETFDEDFGDFETGG
jgi:hypothetical protein